MITEKVNPQAEALDAVVIRFVGDSGDGMQLTGTQFSDTSAMFGNDVATFPNYPSEIRAPQGSLYGVSGFQVHIGSVEVSTPGDTVDLVGRYEPGRIKNQSVRGKAWPYYYSGHRFLYQKKSGEGTV